MRAVVQRVSQASVASEGKTLGQIGPGALILLGVEQTDQPADADWLAAKISAMRIFRDAAGAMNLSLRDVDGEALVVSQFTLHASTRKGNRPSFLRAARPESAVPLYQRFIAALETALQRPVRTGSFGADMQVALVNDGPVTIFIDSTARE